MTGRRLKILVLASLAIAILGGGAALIVLERQCSGEGGQFAWSEVACAAGSRPVILQGDIHRV